MEHPWSYFTIKGNTGPICATSKWISDAFCWMKEAILKILYPVCLQVHGILDKAMLISSCQGAEHRGTACQGDKDIFWRRYKGVHLGAGGCSIIYKLMCQTHRTAHIKVMVAICTLCHFFKKKEYEYMKSSGNQKTWYLIDIKRKKICQVIRKA